jgi:ATP-dependent DNA helicase RecG
MIKRLRRNGLIEGRKPNFHVSASVAGATASKADYIRTRAQDDDYYAKLIVDYLSKFGGASRKEIDDLLLDKLSSALSQIQKKNKIGNIISKLRIGGVIHNAGSRAAPEWRLRK